MMVLLVALPAACALAARELLILTTVDGPSMEPALRSGQRVLIRRTRRPRRGQVVLMRLPDRTLLLKRVAALPGDRVPDDWASPDLHGIGGARVPDGSYAVLGDNRAVSTDSRYFGLVPRDRVVGVMVRLFSGGTAEPARLDAPRTKAGDDRRRDEQTDAVDGVWHLAGDGQAML